MRFHYLKTLAAAAALTLALGWTAVPAAAEHHVNVTSGLTLAEGPLALRGYDPVAYFTVGKPTLGSAVHQTKHDGAVYRFASAANQKAFEANPGKYTPQYGGFCAYGVSVAKKFDGDPLVWKIVNNRLFLNLNPDIQKTWEKDVSGNVKKADGNWPRIASKPAAAL